ncbi:MULTISPECIES: 3-phosphoglycerate kinase [Pseudomonas]|uniref:3-phosphoglycerate kinase n=1 Tax=Pseudomonas gessardii TaxID=78544 RepID=A0A7Y1MLI8_9PSED|nr:MULTISPECIES: 3-phosphoglycerate kinase [Pseudomonas]MBH3423040.1 3-phosphoglycerate kinase [Pseudomonas gessardii]MCF4978471.1 3-phosphoglycerate kinase [Pseudomonas gessardii]MCF4989374.1 3-phosphoglycerate kinase [Pseudomonas gessardii]MCF5083550.1 3-phosphoglycerate kinase [Pseudomonas gessardii]MCF5095915.1 3-phosphoglycerate kinase [Pseudomonas gessardii]
MRKFCCVLLALLPLSAFAYPIDVSKSIKGVSVDYNASDVDGDISSIRLSNYGTNDAACTVAFTNGPEPARVRKVSVPAGKSTNTTVKFSRAIIKMRIKLTCEPK